MKKILLIISLMLICFITYSQKVWSIKDEMTGDIYSYFMDSKGDSIITILGGPGHAIILRPQFDNKGKFDSLDASLITTGLKCVEYGFIIIKFTDETKLQLFNRNRFNCDGNFYFNINKKILTELSNKPIDKIMLENGRDGKSETLSINNPNYFIELYNLIKDKY